jgi:AmmeMemoRadiSam system protein B
MIRMPAVSGSFYPSNKEKLLAQIKSFLVIEENEEKIKLVIAPHAGYIYSGHVAGAVYSKIHVPNNVVLLGPNHTGLGSKFSIMSDGEWRIPLGSVPINSKLANLIKNKNKLFNEDYMAHVEEHSLEVQLPFLLYKNQEVKIVPIAIKHAEYTTLKELGIAIANAIEELGEETLIVVSSDMSHYISQEEAKKKDFIALGRILDLDALGLLEVCFNNDITMCGIFPAVVGIEAVKTLGAKEAKLVKYATSGDINRDYHRVVGYAGVIIK